MNKEELVAFICEMFGLKECTGQILRQIHKYITERGYNYIDIARALSYYVDVQNGNLDLKYGIGIVPYVIDDAKRYFRQLAIQKDQQKKAAENAKRKQNESKILISFENKKTLKKPNIDITNL